MIKAIYTLSVIALFLVAILVKKKEDKMDFITTFFVGIVLFSCYNIISALVLKMFTLNTTLLRLTIINLIVIAPIAYKIYKDKSMQKYYVEKKDILAVVIIAILGFATMYANFGYPINISFLCTDASNHYFSIMKFYEEGNAQFGSLIGSCVNYGIIFKLFYSPMQNFDGIYIFVILETLKLMFSGILIYLTIKQFSKRKLTYVISIILSVIYMIAYPLHGMIAGFVYLQLGVNIASAILIVMVNYEKINNELKNLILFILCFGLVFCYHFLAPPIAMAIIVYELKNFKKDKKNTILNILKILLIPTIVGILWFLVLPYVVNPDTISRSEYVVSEVSKTAYIYTSYFSSFIFFLPFCIYNIVNNVRNKKIDALDLTWVFTVLYIIVLVVGEQFEKITTYYVMKPYYMLWLIMLTITGKVILSLLCDNIKEIYKTLIVGLLSLYIMLLLIFSVIPCSIKVFEDEPESIMTMFNIYRLNRNFIMHENFDILYTSEELELLKEITQKFDNETNILYLEDDLNREWLTVTTGRKENTTVVKEYKKIKQFLLSDEHGYIICLKNTAMEYNFKDFIEELDNQLDVVAKKERLTIYKK